MIEPRVFRIQSVRASGGPKAFKIQELVRGRYVWLDGVYPSYTAAAAAAALLRGQS